jgi:hypothetical protein
LPSPAASRGRRRQWAAESVRSGRGSEVHV